MRYIIFTRVSKGIQKVENQSKECREYVQKNMSASDSLIEFSEPDISTRIKIKDRVVIQEMINFVKPGDCIVVYSLDRFARDGRELTDFYCDMRAKNVKIHSIHQPNVDENYIHIYAFVAMTERKAIRTRTISALNRKKADMERVGATLFGYKLDPSKLSMQKDAKSYGKPYLLIPDETEQRAIEIMKSMRDSGSSFQDIANHLEDNGYRNRKGNDIQPMTILRILKRLQMESPSQMAVSSCVSH